MLSRRHAFRARSQTDKRQRLVHTHCTYVLRQKTSNRYSLQVDDAMLLAAVQPLGGCSDARVVWDLTTGRCVRLPRERILYGSHVL